MRRDVTVVRVTRRHLGGQGRRRWEGSCARCRVAHPGIVAPILGDESVPGRRRCVLGLINDTFRSTSASSSEQDHVHAKAECCPTRRTSFLATCPDHAGLAGHSGSDRLLRRHAELEHGLIGREREPEHEASDGVVFQDISPRWHCESTHRSAYSWRWPASQQDPAPGPRELDATVAIVVGNHALSPRRSRLCQRTRGFDPAGATTRRQRKESPSRRS
jgi:hypothetical protein